MVRTGNLVDAVKSDQDLWGLFTRREEYGQPPLDGYGRFMASSSAHKRIGEPLVSEMLTRQGLRAEYPGGKQFAVCLTHDIDTLNAPSAAAFIEKRTRGGFARRAVRWVDRMINPVWNFGEIIDIEKAQGARSTFFLMALGTGDRDFNYFVDDLDREIANVKAAGFGIGLHGGHDAFADLAKLRAEKATLEEAAGRKVVGYRGHYLKLKVPTTWHLLSEAGFAYDSTLAYPDRVGFRNGMCHPHRPFDLDGDTYMGVTEIPLTIMDSSLFEYMALDDAGAWKMVRELADRVEACNGVLTILWHNTYFRRKAMRSFYERMLAHFAERNAWLTSCEELTAWWHEKDFLEQEAGR